MHARNKSPSKLQRKLDHGRIRQRHTALANTDQSQTVSYFQSEENFALSGRARTLH